MISIRHAIVLIALTAGALGSWYLARQGRGDDDAAPVFETVQQGYYLKSARILGTGADGRLLYELLAEAAEQQENGNVYFTDVSLNYSPQSAVPWRVNADTAVIRQDENRVLLRGHVRAISSEGFSGKDTEIRTQYLEIDPDNYVAETNERVQIRIGERSLTATGMLASLKENRLELRSNVGGKFVP
ncbi:MAG: LPS export ABC transporter periplasmic protein LptC [Desulfobulbaceae bacterium]|nr:LPS export ABC transporter periplasmic protein LptC [Desulfobulbaceae bacterium]